MPNVKQQDQSEQDMRLRENREQAGLAQEHLTKDGQPDHRYKENRDDQGNEDEQSGNQGNQSKQSSNQNKQSGNQGNQNKQSGNQNKQSGNNEEEHLTKEGEPDHRYKENRGDQGKQGQQSNNQENDDEDKTAKLADIPTKSDGTADMRYLESREAVQAGLISKDEVIEDAINGGEDEE